MGDFALGSVTPIIINQFSGFGYPEAAKVTPLLSASSSADLNALLQGGALGFQTASIAGVITSSGNLSTISGYQDAKTAFTFTDDVGTGHTNCRLINFKYTRQMVQSTTVWSFTADIVKTS